MATITFPDLYTPGFELFQDSESFINELSDVDSIYVYGGYDFSALTEFTKLIQGYIYVYAIGQIADIAKSFSNNVSKY